MKAKLNDIILVNTSFNRETSLEFEDDFELDTQIDINHGFSSENNFVVQFSYKMKLDIKNNDELVPQFEYSSTHVAQFETKENEENDPVKIERFANINVAAMIFPFIRENVATISAKAGMSPIMIPVINFIELYERNKNKLK
ncbi:protein-export chaperone SecB [uncultured Chryseobacterium sp.]|uniref:protein-export chaperone SecB n=1 Tax=uncultured Chryseobacterium sp. TaxID=259322 RepID=UPI0025892C57|nr:protein-export chaperone SecB [uncultured Chryseobacterium sp.]